MSLRLLLGITLALVVGACSNKQAEAQDEARRRCEALVQGTSTLRDATEAFSIQPLLIETRTDYAPLVAGDVCPYALGQTAISTLIFQFPTNDCPGAFGGGTCAYRCEVRVVGTAPAPTTVMCARAFITGQPFLFAGPPDAPPPP
jgi:hypothetical protein